MLVFRARPRKDPVSDVRLTNSERRIMKTLSEAMREVRAQAVRDEGKILDAILHSSSDRIANLLTVEPWLSAQPKIQDELFDELISSGQRTRLPTIEKAKVSFSFDADREEASRWAEKEAGLLIVEIVDQQRNVVRDYVARSELGEFTPQQVARGLRDTIGLTEQQAGWVENFRERQIADRMADGVSRQQAYADSERATERYHDRIHRYRTETIARTEILRANTEGRKEAWQQGIEEGFIDPSWRKQWVTGQDERVCDICAPLDGETAPVMGDFPGGDPPAHPNCRCTLNLVPEEDPTEFDDLTDDELEELINDLIDESLTNEYPSTYSDPQLEEASKGMNANSICSRVGPAREVRRDSESSDWECFNDLSDNPLGAAARVDTNGVERDKTILDAVSAYQGSSPQFNAAMQGRTDMTARKEQVITNVQKAIDRSGGLPENTLLYRGLRGYNLDVDALVPGATIEAQGFTSTTFDRKVAERFRNFDDEPGWLLSIEAEQGTKGVPMTKFRTENPQFRDEHEYLLPPTKFSIISRDESSRTLIVRIDNE